jgi:hypothetical protein
LGRSSPLGIMLHYTEQQKSYIVYIQIFVGLENLTKVIATV